MILRDEGREYLTFPTSDSSAGTLKVSFDEGQSWLDVEKPTSTSARVLIAGPDATGNPAGTVVLQLGVHHVWVRYETSDEVIIRGLADTVRVLPIEEI